MKQLQTAHTYSGFTLERVETIKEINSEVYLFRHAILGTPALAIKNDDDNKTFTIAFHTVPQDSTGVAHILEHSVLMGSQKYPVRDVFGEINKGGLMTFLNAMTGSDMTWYPFATRNLQEYFNIMDVYCDVTLNPLLLRDAFEQEGWHYHKESPDQPLEYQGVVLNEMKGAYSDPIRAIFHHTFGGLMPDSTYAHESGGDPKEIPGLTYEQFVAFHRAHYHPSNAILYFYGNAPLEEELAFVNDRFLSSYPEAGIRADIRKGRNITEPVTIVDSYGVQPGSDPSAKTFHAVGSAVGTVLERKRNTAFRIIANILYNSDASPLKKVILNSGLCRDFGGLFLPTSCYKTFMMTYLIGSEPQHREPFLDLFKRTLTELVDQGLDRDLVLSELNKFEFSAREEMTKAQRGLDLFGKAVPALKHGGDPYTFLCIEDILAEIRQQALEEGYFEQLIRERLLDNRETVAVTLAPDPEKLVAGLEEERAALSAYENGLDKEAKETLIARTGELLELQLQPNDDASLQCLPSLRVRDLSEEIPCHTVTPETLGGCPFLVNDLPTKGISYMDFGFDCSHLEANHLLYLNLFATIITEIGSKEKDYMQFAKDLNIYTGGFNHSFHTHTHKYDNNLQPVLWFHLKALSGFLPKAMELAAEVFSQASFADRQHIREIVQREYAWAEHAVQSEGYSLASCRVFAHLGPAGLYNEYFSGVASYLALKELAEQYEAREESFLATLEEIRNQLLRKSLLTLSLTSEQQDILTFQQHGSLILDQLNNEPPPSVSPSFETFPANQAFSTSSEVVYNVQGCSLFPDPARYNGHFEVLRTWLSRDYLWNTVRQVGGAYGCFIQFNYITGNFVLVSYRDPQVRKTFASYDAIRDKIGKISLSNQALEQLIIGTYGNFDPHQSPAVKGSAAKNEYLSGVTPEFKRQRVREILTTTVDDLRSFAPLFEQLTANSYRATIGNAEKIKENKELFHSVVAL